MHGCPPVIAVLLLCALLASGGCRQWLHVREPVITEADATAADDDQRASDSDDVAAAPADAAESSSSEKTSQPVSQQPPAPLHDEAWIIRVAPPEDTRSALLPRWRHPTLEELLDQPADVRPQFAQWLNDDNAVVATNAAIAAARHAAQEGNANSGPTRPAPSVESSAIIDQLAAAVRRPKLKLATRRSAAEALSLPKTDAAAEVLIDLLEQYGWNRHREGAEYQPELHAELLASLARSFEVEAATQLEAAIGSPSAEVRLAAIENWPEAHPVSDILWSLHRDGDPQVRSAVLTLAGQRPGEVPAEIIERLWQDRDLDVRLAAIQAVAASDGSNATQRLAGLLEDSSTKVRAAAAAALTKLGALPEIRTAMADESWEVRREIARRLEPIDGATIPIAAKLILDSNRQVAMAMKERAAKWPMPAAGQVLLAGCQSSMFSVRQESVEQLAQRFEPARGLLNTTTPAQRDALLADLREQLDISAPADTSKSRSMEAENDSPQVSTAELQQIEELLRLLSQATLEPEQQKRALSRLVRFGPALPDSILQIHQEKKLPVPPVVIEKALPQVDPVFAQIEQLRSPDVQPRRDAARELREDSDRGQLHALALQRIADLSVTESDATVLRELMHAFRSDARPAAARFHKACLGDPQADIRRRACEYFVRHPSKDAAEALTRSLLDESQEVVVAALQGLGEVESLTSTLAVVRLLASRDVAIRLAAASVLASHGHAAGFDSLQRLAQHRDPEVRRQAAEAMGATGQRRFTAVLIGMLDDRLGVKQAAVKALSSLAGRDIGGGNRQPRPDLATQIARWKSWYRRQ